MRKIEDKYLVFRLWFLNILGFNMLINKLNLDALEKALERRW